MKDEPHSKEDNEPKGESTEPETTFRRTKTRRTVKVIVSFDDNLQEFQLWDFVYDAGSRYTLESSTDWINRNQIYNITSYPLSIKKLLVFLKSNKFLFHLTKK